MEQSKIIDFSVSEKTVSYWINLDVEEYVSQDVSLEEAANVIDSLFETDPCTNPNALMGGYTAPVIDFEDYSARIKEALGIIDYDPCVYVAGTYTYQAKLYVYRSHVDFPYKLVLSNGINKGSQIVSKEIKEIRRVDGNSIKLDLPIIDSLKVSYEENGVSHEVSYDSFNGGTIYFPVEYNKIFIFEYTTQYDVVTVEVPQALSAGNQYATAQVCDCTVFYQNLMNSIRIEPPEQDDEAVQNIGCIEEDGGSSPPEHEFTDAPGTCYQRLKYTYVCRCSGEVAQHIAVNPFYRTIQVSCDSYWAQDTEAGLDNFWWDDREIVVYTDCPDEPAWEGHEESFYIEKCCDPPPPERALPYCQMSMYTWWPIADPITFGYDLDKTRFVAVAPRDNVCGKTTINWEVNEKNCCDDPSYIDITYNEEDSFVTIADTSSGYVFWNDGAPPYNVTVRGQGFYLDSRGTIKTSIVTDKFIKVYTQDACGPATIEIKDGCSEDVGEFRSTKGNWVSLGVKSSVRSYRPSDICNYDLCRVGTTYGTVSRTEADEVGAKYAVVRNATKSTQKPVSGRVVTVRYWNQGPLVGHFCTSFCTSFWKCQGGYYRWDCCPWAPVGTCGEQIPELYHTNVYGTGIDTRVFLPGSYYSNNIPECEHKDSYMIKQRSLDGFDIYWEWKC